MKDPQISILIVLQMGAELELHHGQLQRGSCGFRARDLCFLLPKRGRIAYGSLWSVWLMGVPHWCKYSPAVCMSVLDSLFCFIHLCVNNIVFFYFYLFQQTTNILGYCVPIDAKAASAFFTDTFGDLIRSFGAVGKFPIVSSSYCEWFAYLINLFSFRWICFVLCFITGIFGIAITVILSYLYLYFLRYAANVNVFTTVWQCLSEPLYLSPIIFSLTHFLT